MALKIDIMGTNWVMIEPFILKGKVVGVLCSSLLSLQEGDTFSAEALRLHHLPLLFSNKPYGL